jgi:hypothetical protein
VLIDQWVNGIIIVFATIAGGRFAIIGMGDITNLLSYVCPQRCGAGSVSTLSPITTDENVPGPFLNVIGEFMIIFNLSDTSH